MLAMSKNDSKEKKEVKGKAKGGLARAKSLTKEQRSEIAKKAAAKRWEGKPLKATHKGNFKEQFDIDAECYILDDQDKTVVVSKTGLSKLLGIGEHGRDIDRLLKTNYMAEFVDPELLMKIEKPLIFQWRSTVPKNENEGAFFDTAHGYDITLIGDVATALIKADMAGALPESRKKSAALAQQLVTASMKLGLKGLGYAIAGYRPEVQEVIDAFKAFVREEARGYEKEFPDELYEEWYRLYQLNRPTRGRPIRFGQLTNSQIYIPLAKSKGKILEQIRANRDENGKPTDKLHLFLSEIGVKALRQHIGKLLGVAAMSESKEEYEAGIKKVFGKITPEV
ncbi:TPA: P63C domain-containing protein [Providencia alcalifaciens]|nr:P63C domain-containing protein [Providencia alcalifaciens]WGZ56244.1 P63C domain-containing protein [Providencia alcalifaciens]